MHASKAQRGIHSLGRIGGQGTALEFLTPGTKTKAVAVRFDIAQEWGKWVNSIRLCMPDSQITRFSWKHTLFLLYI